MCAGACASGMGLGGGVLGIGALPPDLGEPTDLGERAGIVLKTPCPFGGEPAGGEVPTPHEAQVMVGAGGEVRRGAAPFEAPVSL